MKKTFKNLMLTSMLFLGSVFAFNANAGFWFISYCADDILNTYEAEYFDDDEFDEEVFFYEVHC